MKLHECFVLFLSLLLSGCGETKDPNLALIGEHKFTMRGNSAYTMQLNIDKKEATFTYLYEGISTTKTRYFSLKETTKGETGYSTYYTDEEVGRYGYILNFEDRASYNTDSSTFNNFMSSWCEDFRYVVVYKNLDDETKGTTFYSTGDSFSKVSSDGVGITCTVCEFF